MAKAKTAKKEKTPASADAPAEPTTAVATTPAAPQLPATPAPEPEAAPLGLEVIDREDMIIPRYSVLQAQPAQKMGVKPGGFLDKLSDEQHTELKNVVLLRVTKGRVFFAPMEEGGGVICASDDRVAPAVRIDGPIQTKCAGCPKAQWLRTGGKNEPPDCADTYTFLLSDDGMPYFFTLKSGAIRASKKLLTQLTLKARKAKKPAFAFQFDVKTELLDYAGGTTAYQPVFHNLRPIAKGDLEMNQAMYDAFAEAQPTFDDNEEAASDGSDGQNDFPFGESGDGAPAGADA